jgi:hypothetical protein
VCTRDSNVLCLFPLQVFHKHFFAAAYSYLLWWYGSAGLDRAGAAYAAAPEPCSIHHEHTSDRVERATQRNATQLNATEGVSAVIVHVGMLVVPPPRQYAAVGCLAGWGWGERVYADIAADVNVGGGQMTSACGSVADFGDAGDGLKPREHSRWFTAARCSSTRSGLPRRCP